MPSLLLSLAIRAVLPILSLSLFTACVTEQKPQAEEGLESVEDPPAPEAKASVPPGTIKSVQEWDALDKSLRFDVMEDGYRSYPNLQLTSKVDPSELKDPTQRAFVEKMLTFMRSNGDLNVEDPTRAKVGPLATSVQLLLLDGKTILAGAVSFQQAACDMPDETSRSFSTTEEAKKAGCAPNPGSWHGHGTFDRSGTPFEYSDYLEWSGPEPLP